jgi:hypothetical protein
MCAMMRRAQIIPHLHNTYIPAEHDDDVSMSL